jgi:hypothetical protein
MSDGGRAVIEGGCIVIRIEISALPLIVPGAWGPVPGDDCFKVTDAEAFARDLVAELNREEEDGTTPVHRMFDAVIQGAIENGAEGVEIETP